MKLALKEFQEDTVKKLVKSIRQTKYLRHVRLLNFNQSLKLQRLMA